MANKPQNAVRGAARALAYETVRHGQRAQNIAKNTSNPGVLKNYEIQQDHAKTVKQREGALLSATQFAQNAGAGKLRILGAYYRGVIPGIVKGLKDNYKEGKQNG